MCSCWVVSKYEPLIQFRISLPALSYLNLVTVTLYSGCVETRWIKDRDSLDLLVRTNPYNIRDNCTNSAPIDVPTQPPCRRGEESSIDKILTRDKTYSIYLLFYLSYSIYLPPDICLSDFWLGSWAGHRLLLRHHLHDAISREYPYYLRSAWPQR